MAHRARTAALHFGAHGIGNAGAEEPLRRVRQLRERDDVAPDAFGWSIHIYVRVDGEFGRIRRRERFRTMTAGGTSAINSSSAAVSRRGFGGSSIQ